MTVKECYAAMGGNYDEAFTRLRSDERIARFLKKLLDDGSFALLETSLETKDVETAFRAAHTLKGVCMNLSVTTLFESTNAITEALRGRTEYGDELKAMFEKVKADYSRTIDSINRLD